MPSKDAGISVSVVVVSYNTRELTLRCLTDLYADLGDKSAEVFVVDNGSNDGSAAAVRKEFPAADVIELWRNAGFGPANNVAIANARGEFVLLLNTDAFLRRGAVAALVGYLETHPRAAAVGPRVLNADGSLQRSCYKFPGPLRAFFEHTLLTAAFPNNPIWGDYRAWPHDSERNVDFVIGACMLVRRAAIVEVGPFDEAFFMYSEETDWCRRFRNHGWAVAFTPKAQVMHLNGGSGKQASDRVFNEFRRGAERYIRKHHGFVGLSAFRACLIAGATTRIFVFSVQSLLSKHPAKKRQLAREWSRILWWNLGARGPGLSST